MQNLTQYSDDELSLMVMNDEALYSYRHDTESLFALLTEYFVFTDEQMDVLIQDLADDAGEQE